MTEAAFIQKNNAYWKELETILEYPAETFAVIDRRMFLYRTASGHLSYARSHYKGSTLCTYLENLTAEAHAAVYAYSGRRTQRFFSDVLPRSVWENWKFILASAAIFLALALVGFAVSWLRPELTDAFLPASMKGVNTSDLRMDERDMEDAKPGPVLSNLIMVNNIYVSVLAFGLGITCGAGTVYVLAMNGCMLGGLAAFYAVHGSSVFFWSIILPHGVWELTAIFIAGGAGLSIGHSLIRPGQRRRADALLTAARSALCLMLLATAMLIVAGIIEGFITPLPIPPWVKLSFSAATAVPLILLVWYVRRCRRAATLAGALPKDIAEQNG